MDKVLIMLSVRSGGVSIISHARVIGTPAGTISSSFTLVFSLTTGIIKKLLKETLMSQALIDFEISHEEFKTIVNEKEEYDQMKESIRNKKDKKNFSENE